MELLGNLGHGFFCVPVELPHRIAAIFVVHHLRQKLRWDSNNVRSCDRGVLDVHHRTDTANQNFGGIAPFIEPLAHMPNHDARVVSFVGHAPGKNAHVRSARFRGQNGLIEGENGGGIDRNALRC